METAAGGFIVLEDRDADGAFLEGCVERSKDSGGWDAGTDTPR